ncbi:SET domain-containing protein [Armillaria solidipes]|uniref:SET domain-containing protein n=1 Tax=Armillaria solidipes TaxID=1076256 RepID=A0A2H3BKZ8_9AGAR|nr:SET domain-containing protein [Armillaria solidipes]
MKRGFLTTAKAKRQFSALNPENTEKPTREKSTSLPAGSVDDLKDLKIVEGMVFACVMSVIPTLTNSALASVSAPDDNDPGAFVNTPHEDDDLSHHVQVPFPGGWTQCLISGYLNRRLKYISGFPRPLKETRDQVYRISSSPGKGLGMFATRKIKMGDLIIDERPLMVVSLSPVGLPGVPMREGLTPEEKYQYLLNHSENVMRSVFGRMSEESKNVFMDLRNSHLHDGSGPILGVVRTNGYGLGDDLKDKTIKHKVGRYTSVYKDLSRVNHSCSPNTHRKFYMSSFSMQLRAARDIEEGEEIFTTYTGILRPAAERAEALLPYGIKCTCRACLDPANSDPIRAAVLNRPCVSVPMVREAGARPDAWIDPAVQTLARIQEEGLEGSEEYYKTLHQLYNAYVHQNDEKKALMYGEKLWVANLAAGEKRYDAFRKVELMKKSPQWMIAKMMGGLPVVRSFI